MTARAELIPFADYRQAPGVNKSWLDEMDKSPLHFKTYGEREDKPTEAMNDGRLIHSCVLEPALYDATTCIWEGGETKDGKPSKSKNTTAYKAFKAEQQAQGRDIISASKDWTCRQIKRAVIAHPVAGQMLVQAEVELSIFWTHPIGIACKSRLDMLCHGDFVADLKTAADITPDGFGKAACRYGYGVQAAMYQDAALALTGEVLPYYIIAVEKVPPFDVAVYEIGGDILAMGRSHYCDNLRKVKSCRESGEWPGVAPSVQSLEFPPWAYTDEDDVLDWDGMEASA